MTVTLIPIKHPDGTIEKITLEEFRARQKALAVAAPKAAPVKPILPTPKAEAPKVAPVKPTPPALKTEAPKPAELPRKVMPTVSPAPQAPKQVAVAPEPITSAQKTDKSAISATKFTADDAKSLLEEELPATTSGAPMGSQSRGKEAEEIVKKLNLPLAQETMKRLIGLVQLRLKDIRSEDDVKDWLELPENQMGIGLSADKAGLVLKACRDYTQKISAPGQAARTEVAPLKRPLGTPAAPPTALRGTPAAFKSMSTALAKEDREPLPAVSAEVAPFLREPAKPPVAVPASTKEPRSAEAINKIVEAEARSISAEMTGLAQRKEPTARPVMRDIAPAKPTNLGPVEEIKYLSLVDFRRLSSDPAEAAARLKQKFLNLKEESYILYLNGLEAWRQSPLFLDLSGAMIESLNSKKKISDAMADKNKIQLKEIQAIIQMEKELV